MEVRKFLTANEQAIMAAAERAHRAIEMLAQDDEKVLEIQRGTNLQQADITEKVPGEMPYKPHYLDNPKVLLAADTEKGNGVFAKEAIEPSEIIAIFDAEKGQVFQAENLSDLSYTYIVDRVVQIGQRKFLNFTKSLAVNVNHSCDPNCGLRDWTQIPKIPENSVAIVARRPISPGEEISWDYAMSEDSDWLLEECLCGSPNCREQVTAFRDLPEAKRAEYENWKLSWLSEERREKLKRKLVVEVYRSATIPPELIDQIAKYFITTFSNYWKNYLFCSSCEEKGREDARFSALEIYPNNGKPIPYEVLNQLPLCPNCPHCSGPMQQFMDHDRTRQKLESYLYNKAYISLIRDENSGQIFGMSFGNQCSLEEAFKSQEWSHPYSYANAKARNPKFAMDPQQFYGKVLPALQQSMGRDFSATDQVFLSNCVITSPEIRGRGLLPALMRAYGQSIPPEICESLPVIGEVDIRTRFHRILTRAGLHEVKEALADSNYSIMLGPLSEFVTNISLPPEQFGDKQSDGL